LAEGEFGGRPSEVAWRGVEYKLTRECEAPIDEGRDAVTANRKDITVVLYERAAGSSVKCKS
jgi:hypothetical protein